MEKQIRHTLAIFLGAVGGALFLSFLSYVQKVLIGAPVSLDGFLIPVLFGAASGLIITLWAVRLVEKNRSLREINVQKEILLQEVHHRVKNNLQLILSMMNLGQSCTGCLSPDEVIDHLQKRIMVLAYMHEHIFGNFSDERVGIRDFLLSLADYLRSMDEAREIMFTVDIQDVRCSLCEMVTFGLLLYEIVNNSISHAFPEGKGPRTEKRITIRFFQDDTRQLHLLLDDNGCGLPFEGDPFDHQSLGFTLIGALCKQLQGSAEADRNNGLLWHLSFPCCGK